MWKIDIILRILVLGTTITCVQPAVAQSFEYSNLFNAAHEITLQTKPALVASGDRAVDAYFCNADEEFICVDSEWFNFAIPSGKSKLSSEWTRGENAYKLIGSEQLVLLGTRRDVIRIESTQKGKRYRFLYSRRYGLIGFSGEVDGQPVTFISQRVIGFGASSARISN